MDAASIRIDATLLKEHQGKIVRLIGKCESYDPSASSAILISNGQVNISLATGESMEINKIYEIIGKVSSTEEKVTVYSIIELSDNLNLDIANNLVKYVHKVPELFF